MQVLRLQGGGIGLASAASQPCEFPSQRGRSGEGEIDGSTVVQYFPGGPKFRLLRIANINFGFLYSCNREEQMSGKATNFPGLLLHPASPRRHGRPVSQQGERDQERSVKEP